MQERHSEVLDQYAFNLTQLALQNKLDVYEDEVDEENLLRVMQVISRRAKNNPILLSSSTSLIDSYINKLAMQIMDQESNIPENIFNIQIFKLDISHETPQVISAIFSKLIPFRPRSKDNKHDAVVYIAESTKLLSLDKEIANHIYRGISHGVLDCILGMTVEQYKILIEDSYPTNRKTQIIMLDSSPNSQSRTNST